MKFGRLNSRVKPEVEPEEIFIDAALAGSDPVRELEGKIERPLGVRYSMLFIGLASAGILYLLGRSFSLQIASGEEFFASSQENRFASRTVYPPRGVIRDRFGEVLAESEPSFGLLLDRERFQAEGGDLRKLIEDLGEPLGKPPSFFTEIGLLGDADLGKTPRRIFIARELSLQEAAAVARPAASLPGLEIFESYRRVYRDRYAFSHLVGFVGKISTEDLRLRPELAQEETIGKSGLENFYDWILRGKAGRKIVEVDSRGTETRYRLTESPHRGAELALTVDGGLQRVGYELIRNYTAGGKGASFAALDPRSGAVLALVSFPGFDSNDFGQGLSPEEFAAVVSDPLKPLFNRAISGEFPSGSAIKPLVAAAALQEKLIDPKKKIFDPGYLDIPNPYRPGENSRFLDWREHGWIDLYDAIAYSANVYFYIIGGGYRDQKGLGIEKIKSYAEAFGLGSLLGVDLPGEKAGSIPDPESKKTREPADPIWRVGDTYNAAIGQGGVRVTPLQMASLASAIGNRGTLWRPYLLESARDAEGNFIEKHSPRPIRQGLMREDVYIDVREGMRQTVTRGTARLLQQVPVAVAAKTGTAQSAPGKPPHAWVIAFAPAENPEIAMALMVEHAGEGATVAVPITNEILKWYFTHQR